MLELYDVVDIKSLPREELKVVPHDVVKWFCQCKGCSNGTSVWDFGISPQFFHPRKDTGWCNLTTQYWMCGKHHKIIKKLLKNYTLEHIERRMLDSKKGIDEKIVRRG